jgi:hypothetical protein
MRAGFAIIAVVIGAAASSPARALNNDDIAALMGMLWRLQDHICPSISFDPAKLIRAMNPPGASPAAVRRSHRAAFQKGYALAGDWLSQGSNAQFCKNIENLVDGKHDFFGNLKDVPQAPFPGVTIRD